ncbi:GntR family transcriptional regulator [Streptomyces sp. NPDC088387]|uniref:GntR family transcriptional regulator n=1 Tax=Streptomyces sp. NPDC088387 TaxID=3365859 RepID=UPI0038188D38
MGVDATPQARAPHRTHTPAPLWSQTADLILEQIESEQLPAGSRLAAERELAARFDISRVTLRKALNHLVDRGILTASHGRGWFVASPVADREWPNDLESFTATARRKHMVARSLVLHQDVQPASLDDADRLQLPAGTPLIRLVRVRMLNNVRVAMDRTLFPESIAPGVIGVDFTTASLFEELHERGVEPSRSVTTIEARSADDVLAGHLGLEPAAPILVLDQVVFGLENTPIMLSTVEYSGDRYRLRTTLRPR